MDAPEKSRRDFVLVSAAVFAGTGCLLALWPFVAQMNPGADMPPPPKLDVDLSAVALGQTITVKWRERPVFVRRRTGAEIDMARAIEPKAMRDPLARNETLPPRTLAHDANRTVNGHPEWLVVVAICTRDACVLKAAEHLVLADGESFACPCCNARYDTSGRAKTGAAPTNLTIPRYEFASPMRIRLF